MTLLSDAIAKEIPGRPVPFVDADNKPFYDGCARCELLIQRCLQTRKFQFASLLGFYRRSDRMGKIDGQRHHPYLQRHPA